MLYDSLLLNCGGGIISKSQKSKQYSGAAALAIGIGGTGVAALAELKSKVYQQLEPDNPNEVLPRYDHIQFLAIDSDETDIDKMRGKARLNKGAEFFNISNPHLKAALAAKGTIKGEPVFNWMDIDRIDQLLSPQGAGGVRQVGRFLLLSKADQLKLKIEEKCTTALKGLGKPALDIYVFAGISGGTGSGCFLDVCYIIRKALEDKGWGACGNIMGFFFLPDVVTSKPEVAAIESSVAYNHSNGYAAMKELDYLMGLKTGDDWFEQNYGNFQVRTQDPPVDLCHLVSATRADGSVLSNGFGYGVHVASDYVMAYLADVELGGITAGAGDGGLTMRGHLSNVNNGVSQLARRHGASLSYHVLGASNAEIPMTQITTYLASGFYRRFQECVGRDTVLITKAAVDDWAQKLGLTADSIYDEVVRETDHLFLPEIERRDLASMGPMPKKKAPECWATPGNDWLSRCSGKREQNRKALNGEMGSWTLAKATDDSLVGRVFRRLYELSVDPGYGPYYAAGLLNHAGYDLMSAIDGAIKTAQEQRNDQLLQVNGNSRENSGGMADYMMQCSADFCHRPNKKNYGLYCDCVTRWYITNNRVAECSDVITTLQNLKSSLQKMYNTFFLPLLDMLDNLKATFAADEQYLSSAAAAAPTAYTWRILELSDVKGRLDRSIDALEANELVNKFVAYILDGYERWKIGDESEISNYISEFFEQQFVMEMNRSLEDYLYERFPEAGNDPTQLAQVVENNIVQEIHQSALPMFWCDPSFQLMNTSYSFQASSISVPRSAAAVCAAAKDFKTNHAEYTVRQTGLQDRLFALRFFSGIPFYAYKGVTLLKDEYDKSKEKAAGVGAHLYAYTGRGEDGSGMKDWRNFLPSLMPTSKMEQLDQRDQAALRLYEEGEAAGIIQQKATGDYVVLETDALELPQYRPSDFMENDVFRKGKLDNIRRELQEKLATIHQVGAVRREVLLKNDGAVKLGTAVVERVRKDYFVHYPRLQAIVKQELEKREALRGAIHQLDEIQKEHEKYSDDLGTFCDLIFYGILPCTDGAGKANYTRISRVVYDYTDARGQAQSQVLAENSRDLPYAQSYPLYQAFLTYRSLDSNKLPRREMDEKVVARRKELLQADDNRIGYTLEQAWDRYALSELDERTGSLTDREKDAVMGFYYALVRNISLFKEKFTQSDWERGMTREEGSAPVSPASPRAWTVWDGSKYLYVYEGNLAYGWDQTTNQWVPLADGMQVWNAAQNAWMPLVRNAQGGYVMP